MPIDFAWTSQTSALQLDLLAYSLPRAIAAGALAALITAVLLTTLGSVVAAWITALGGMSVLLINHVFGESHPSSVSLSTMNFIDSLAGGAALGALGAAVLHHRLPAYGWTLGVLTSVLIGSVNPLPHVGGFLNETVPAANWHPTDMPPMWMILVTMALLTISALANRKRRPVDRPSIELPMTPILAGVLLVLVFIFSAEWLSRHGQSLADIGVAVLATVGGAIIAAMLLPGRDGGLVLLVVAVSAVGSAAIAASVPAWTIPLLLIVTALGLLGGSRKPAPTACLIALLGLAVYTAFTSNTESSLLIMIGTTALAWIAGYALGSATPRFVPNRVLGTVMLFVPSAVLGLRDFVSRGNYVLRENRDDPLVCTITPQDSASPAWAAFAITIGCLIGWRLLHISRPATEPTGAAPGSSPDSDADSDT
ncbi:hypothetical protein HLB23_37890 [Nocardia uniformis]|uniref:NocH n=2 Tax=Nocardia uniformis TaxID=53432 RepID=A0A849CHR6_9NOCA|nr:hypothetical protein [Nocardia uniformis]NNH75559.1 hypothetical protein [Nocardia uniformis]